MKPSPKPIVDPVVQKAKQDFLMSGIPEKMRNEIEKQKVYEDYILNEAPLFPETSHIHQFDATDDDAIAALNEGEYKDLKIQSADDSDSPMAGTIVLGCFTELESKDFETSKADKPKYIGWPRSTYSAEGVKDFLRQLKADYGNFPTYRCYKFLNSKSSAAVLKRTEAETTPDPSRQSKTKKRAAKKAQPSPEKPTLDLDDSVEIVEEPKQIFSAANGEQLFSETFKPASSDEFIINPTPIGKLKTFLTSWQSSAAARLLTPKTNGYDSSDDFVGSDSNVSASTTCNPIVLCGPHSCGKTSSVYALANEMKFNILEVNAGNKRTGKKLLQELLEATQSHQVRNNEDKPESSKKKTKSKFLTEQENSESADSSNRKMSLILIEDADIVFDADFGFVDAINQLVTISKRPVIIMSNSSNCAHLLRHIQQNSIDFMSPGCDAMSKWLSIMCLAENVPMDDQVIRRLYLYNQKDVRRTILELQFYVQSGGDRLDLKQMPAVNGVHKTNNGEYFVLNE
jgi:DNA polymerase III delta prime subunit